MSPQRHHRVCPRCGSTNVAVLDELTRKVTMFMCEDCEYTFKRSTDKGAKNRVDDDFEEEWDSSSDTDWDLEDEEYEDDYRNY